MSETGAELLKVAARAAREAGVFIRKSIQSEIVVNEAHHHDLKIQLDVDTQELLTRTLLGAYPDHALLGEEGGEGSEGQGYEWIVDPIDGTVNLAYGIPHFCVSVACRHQGVMEAGVVYDPMRDEMFSASRGGGAFLNGQGIRVSERGDLGEAIMALGFSKNRDSIDKCLELYQFYAVKARKLRAMGSAALDMAYIACGRMDVYIEQGIKIWDVAAGQLLIEEAGGRVELTPRVEKHHFHVKAWNGRMDLPFQ
ncbi:MAG: inositol monophosphatase [Blastochloris sp.]|nr:inositol monophosphatase [Blastochloris sp.]